MDYARDQMLYSFVVVVAAVLPAGIALADHA
jgi:hypothetical protein